LDSCAYNADLDKVYWAESDKIVLRMNPDGSNVETLTTSLGNSRYPNFDGIAFDAVNKTMYLADWYGKYVHRCDYDANQQTAWSVSYDANDVYVDPEAGYVYTLDEIGAIYRYDLAGANETKMIDFGATEENFANFAYDDTGGHFYAPNGVQRVYKIPDDFSTANVIYDSTRDNLTGIVVNQ